MHLKPSGADKPSITPPKAHMAGCDSACARAHARVHDSEADWRTVDVHVETAAAVKLITKELKWKQKSRQGTSGVYS